MDELEISFSQSGARVEELERLLWNTLWKPLGLPRDIRESFKLEGEEFQLIAKAHGRCVGGLVGVWTGRHDVELRHLAVAHDAQKRGVGKRLVTVTLEMVAAKGCSRVYTIARNTSVDFFKKLGFRTTADPAPEHPAFKRHGIVFAPMETLIEHTTP